MRTLEQQRQRQPKAPTPARTKYLVTDQLISFLRPDTDTTPQLVARAANPTLFEFLREALLETGGATGELPLTAPAPTMVKQAYLESVRGRRSRELFGVGRRLAALEEAGMPTSPFERFVADLQPEFFDNPANIEFLSTRIGTTDAPLTWDGGLILYQRASWIGRARRSDAAWGTTGPAFRAGQELVAAAAAAAQPLLAGEFGWAMNQCPDTGPVFEVLVRARDIIGLSKGVGSGRLWSLGRLTQLGRLGTTVSDADRAPAPVVTVQTQCVGVGANAIRLPVGAAAISHLVASLLTNEPVPTQTPDRVPVRAAVRC